MNRNLWVVAQGIPMQHPRVRICRCYTWSKSQSKSISLGILSVTRNKIKVAVGSRKARKGKALGVSHYITGWFFKVAGRPSVLCQFFRLEKPLQLSQKLCFLQLLLWPNWLRKLDSETLICVVSTKSLPLSENKYWGSGSKYSKCKLASHSAHIADGKVKAPILWLPNLITTVLG